ncbi:alpha/beta fold hydrolase [Sphingomonas bacterium]|uniref:alpha/beta fold hydrolase n=1 Tax=Sphingomonas bacterium TaxID=1895847 RepID=UPI001576A9DF|nr:alpha/beta hydrolase [Sphingomonas bacterium]
MILHLRLSLAASAVALAAVISPSPAHCQTVAHVALSGGLVTTALPHVSIASTGRGSPIVLIPGLSSPREVWAATVPTLARDHRVVTVQINGFGGDAPGENLKPGLLDGVVADLHAYLQANRLAHAAVIGHSLGGLVALMLARAHPEDAGRLLIVDALPFVGEIFVPNATVAMLAPQAAAMRDGMATQYGKPDNPAADAAIAQGLALTPAARAQVAGWVARADPRVSAQALYEDLSTDLRPDLAGIATPITLIYPWSPLNPKERAEPLYRAAYAKAPHITVVAVADSGHFVMLDQPAAFSAAVDAFLR